VAPWVRARRALRARPPREAESRAWARTRCVPFSSTRGGR
jgi:hypothetical protein